MILVTGGAGYIGSHVNKELTRRGYSTVVYDNLSFGHKEMTKWGVFVEGDLNNPQQIRSVFDKWPIKAVMHFAAFAYVGESVENPQIYYMNNLGGTLNLLRAMLEANVTEFVFSSSCATYGIPQEIPIPETHPRNPVSAYGRTKLMVEQILEDYRAAYGMKYVSLRYFNAAGADPEGEIGEWHDPETHLIPLVLEVALGKRQEIKIFGTDYDTPDGTCIRDYVHVTDLADAHVLALEYLENGGESGAFNLGNQSGFSVREVINEARHITGRKIAENEWKRRAGDPARLVGSSEKVSRVLSWRPRYAELSEIVSSAWAWHQKIHD
ncbi:MAG: UDP-glucose 4-epimerase GalE [Pseudomonadota bacterium]